jgi:hypothetical protein
MTEVPSSDIPYTKTLITAPQKFKQLKNYRKPGMEGINNDTNANVSTKCFNSFTLKILLQAESL